MKETLEKPQCNRPTVLVFSTDWCSNCRLVLPVLKDMERDSYGTQIDFYHVDADNCTQEMIDNFNVSELPAMFVWDNPEWSSVSLEGAKEYCAKNYRVRGTDYYTREDVEKLCKECKKDIKNFDKFIYGQGCPLCEWEDNPACYWVDDVERFLA